MDRPGELSALSRMALPNVAAVTNVGTSHIGRLGSRAAIARAKAEVAEGLTALPGGGSPSLALPDDLGFDGLFAAAAEAASAVVAEVGPGASCAFRRTGTRLDADGRATFSLSLPSGGEVSLPHPLLVPGRHAALDASLALACASLAGLSPQEMGPAAAAVADMPPAPMRLERRASPRGFDVIDDTYNASPSSCAAALSALAASPCDGRRVAVLGEIGELGDQAPRLHALVGAYAAACQPDMLVLVGGAMADEAADAARTMGLAGCLRVVRCVGDAASLLLGGDGACALRPGDLVLAKASRFVGMDALVRELLAE